MNTEVMIIVQGELLDETMEHNVLALCHYADIEPEALEEMIEEGILEPKGRTPDEWFFSTRDFKRARLVSKLQHDLGVNLPGAALVIELLERYA